MTIIPPGSTIGIVGGGQLGRMAAMAASSLGYKVNIYTDQENSSASHVANKTIVAQYSDEKALKDFVEDVDIVTFEFENIPHESIKVMQEFVPIHPSWEVLHVSQNRLREKKHINSIGIETAPYREVNSASDLKQAYKDIGTRCILKTVEFGYDGKGQFTIDDLTDIDKLWQEINIRSGILEGMVNFSKEVSVVIARNEEGQSSSYVAVENIHKNGILDTTIAPAEIEESVAVKAKNIAVKLADSLDLIGLLAVEMFITADGDVLVNEIAPRPHNSGHWTIDACVTSQFEQFIRAVCGLPLGSTEYHSKALMQNLIGSDIEQWHEYAFNPNAKIHLYGKTEARDGRKMGHVTTIAPL